MKMECQKILNVLIVDDESVSLLGTKSLFKYISCKVIAATNGKEALNALHANEINLILTDINMPHMNGIELTKKIRNSKSMPSKIPIFGITAGANDTEIQNAKNAGMNKVFSKPMAIEDLTVLLNEITNIKNSYV